MLNSSISRMNKTIVAVSLMGLVLAGCANSPFQKHFVAKVDNMTISQQDFQQKYDQLLKTMNMDVKNIGDSAATKPLADMFKKITLQNLIVTTLVSEEAQKRHITVSDAELKEMFDSHVSRMGGEDQLKSELAKMNISMDEFNTELKQELIKQKVVDALTANKVDVTEKEARRYYESNRKLFDEPEKVRARHILVAASPQSIREDVTKIKQGATPEEINKLVENAMADKKKKAEAILQQVKTDPKSFETIAQRQSDDEGSAKMGGDLGYFSRDVVVPSFGQAAFSTKPGQLHDGVVQSPFGFHVIQVIDRKPARAHGFAEVKEQITAFLATQQKNRIMETWLDNRKREAKIVIDPAYDFDKQQAAQAIPAGEKAKKGS